MFSPVLLSRVESLLAQARAARLQIATAESCTAGLVCVLLTEIAGSSDVFERGFVTYSNQSKVDLLGVSPELIERYGAVSEEVARAMVKGALEHSQADIAVAVTGIAGPGGGSAQKPIGLVHLAAARSDRHTLYRQCLFGNLTRSEIRDKAAQAALELLAALI